uniref:Uncharacterized protein n=1 Tax=Arundo donax TaxID=35708 RepID=A0A0A9ANZ4_ARUDO
MLVNRFSAIFQESTVGRHEEKHPVAPKNPQEKAQELTSFRPFPATHHQQGRREDCLADHCLCRVIFGRRPGRGAATAFQQR